MEKNLFESWAKFCEGKKRRRAKEGFLFINNEKITFKSYEKKIFQEILLTDINNLVKERNYLQIITSSGKIYTFWTLTGAKKPDYNKTNAVYSLLLSLEGVKVKSEQKIIEKLKSMIEVSDRIPFNMLKEVLGVDSSIFYQNIFNLAAKLGLTIDGDYLEVRNISVLDFIRALNEHLNLGIREEMLIDEKLLCQYCGTSLKPNMKFCPSCGVSLIEEDKQKD